MSETIETLGGYLRRERKKRDISVEQVAYATRISLKMLNALEEDRHWELPAQPFVRGYLQAYSKYVNLDTKDVFLRYQHHLATQPEALRDQSKNSLDAEYSEGKEKQHVVWITSALLLVLCLSGSYFWLRQRLEKQENQIASQAPILKNLTEGDRATSGGTAGIGDTIATTSAAKSSDPLVDLKRTITAPAATTAPASTTTPAVTTPPQLPAPTPPAAATAAPAAKPEVVKAKTEEEAAAAPAAADNTPKTYNLTLRAKEDVWVRFQTDDEEIKDLIIRKDRAITIRANKLIKMFSGNVAGLSGALNGKALDTLTVGDWKRSVVIPFSEAPNVKLPLFPGGPTEGGDLKTEARSTQNPASSGTSQQ